MLEFYKFGMSVVSTLSAVTKFFFTPMNDPAFADMLVVGDLPSWISWIQAPGALLIRWLSTTFVDLSLAQILISSFLPIFFTVTMIKWILPTS